MKFHTHTPPVPHRLKTCIECGSLIDAMGVPKDVDTFLCADCATMVIYPPTAKTVTCPFVFDCLVCGSFTHYDTRTMRYSCQNADCVNFNHTKRTGDSDFGEYYKETTG